ncbi:MAG TPA: prealbumin-like fold domain-containing protein [Rhizomicrobium sp.]
MKLVFVRVALACAALAVMSGAAMAKDGHLAGVKLTIGTADWTHQDQNAIRSTLSTVSTDANGQAVVAGLAPGRYEIVIDGPSFVAAMDMIAPPPEKESGGPSVSIGGGLFGGTSHSSSNHEGAGPRQGGSHSSSGGIGLGLSVPLGGSPQGQPSSYWVVSSGLDWEAFKVSYETPYCRDDAGQGMRLLFTVPQAAGPLRVTIFATNVFDKHNPTGVY